MIKRMLDGCGIKHLKMFIMRITNFSAYNYYGDFPTTE